MPLLGPLYLHSLLRKLILYISCDQLPLVICSGLMYGYAVSGAEGAGSLVANLTTYPVPDGFKTSIVPSLLFGSLISATDPGKFIKNIRTRALEC